MADDGMRAKARALFGSEFMGALNGPAAKKMVNSAAAAQKTANSRPIPVYKKGGPVKKADGGDVFSYGQKGRTPVPAAVTVEMTPNASTQPVTATARAASPAQEYINPNRPVSEEVKLQRGPKVNRSERTQEHFNPEETRIERNARMKRVQAQANAAKAKAAWLASRGQGSDDANMHAIAEQQRQMLRDAGAPASRINAVGFASGGAAKSRKGMCHKDGGPIRIDLNKAKKDTEARDKAKADKRRREMLGSDADIVARGNRSQATEAREEASMPTKKARGGAAKVRKGVIPGAIKPRKGIGGVM